jgi:hypothetical protein
MMHFKSAIYVLGSLLLLAGGSSAQAAPVVDTTGLIAGATNEITLTGGTPFKVVKVRRSIIGLGEGPCFPSGMLENLCYEILSPRVLGTATLDASGSAVINVTIPAGAAGTSIWVQPFEFRGYGSTLGAVTEWYIDAWVDGCTDPTASNYDPSATVDDGTCIVATCPGGGAAIYTQADVDLYINCTELDYVYVHAITDLWDFDLPLLEVVHGYFYFYGNPNVTKISVPALEEVEGYVYLDGNDLLETVNLESLTYIENYLYVTGNDVLASISLLSLTTIEEYAYFDNDILCVDASLDWDMITDYDHYIADPTC